MKKDFISNKVIEITKQDNRIVVSHEGIEIRREGKPISIEVVGTGFVYLVVDCSGSMSAGHKLAHAKKGALNFAKDAFTKGYLTGLIKFESSAIHLCEPQQKVSVLQRYLDTMYVGGSTNMAEAIQLATENLRNRRGVRVMVIVTDGAPDSVTDALFAAQKAKKNGIKIITIGTDDADRNFLRSLASETELTVVVSRDQLERSITSAVKMLPAKSEFRTK